MQSGYISQHAALNMQLFYKMWHMAKPVNKYVREITTFLISMLLQWNFLFILGVSSQAEERSMSS